VVQEVAAAGEQVDAAVAIAEQVAACAPLAVQATRESARVTVEQGVDAAKADLMTRARALMATEDATEGMLSFVERREARFNGR
jgi:enoyl-CoA hydratase/carnithine racemase